MKPYAEDTARDIVGRQAAQWLCTLAEGDVAQRAAFVAWLKQSPRHVEEFLFASATLKGLEHAGPDDAASIERLILQARSAPMPADIVALQRDEPGDELIPPAVVVPSPRRHRHMRLFGIAATALLAIGAIWIAAWLVFPRNTYATAMGEQRTVRLADGSVVHLNALSSIAVNYSAGGRDIELKRGEAIFKVEPDAARPFRVHANEAIIQALGTQFNVYRRPSGTAVSVLEGAVSLREANSAVKLIAGEEADIATGGRIAKRAEADVVRTVAWRARRLVFRADRLEDIAAEFNRYSPRRIELSNDTVRNRRITGTFDADDPDSLMLFIDTLSDLKVERRDQEFVIRER